ncbi:MAG: tRNA pseudouridine(55) synthase TruB [Rhodobiaceae bacterium]|nr:tRNA pseudouridine(55) synthase TruB [Rhodobiaceae bacterium]MCC0015979.1 tRNA pseudouridine(55) synthase TruB [Rhodobiaceae bacterium]MCC0042335.1 tRNA pseudouridine(55) synthase TruB [Rhodobiaceae bacterium]
MGRRHRKSTVHGWLVLDKPLGMSSNQALSRLKRIFDCPKAGHAGTLDPLASGLLPVALGEATKTVPFIVDAAKIYRFDAVWGARTATDDLEGEIVAESASRPTAEEIDRLLPRFVGRIAQVPPAYSAIKVAGERAYARARSGEAVEMAEREVDIHRLERLGTATADERLERTTLECDCGKGTYIRAIARDLGAALGCQGHVGALRRLRVGPFMEADMVTFEIIEAAAEHGADGLTRLLRPLEVALTGMTKITLRADDAATLARGQPALLRGRDAPLVHGPVCVMCEGRAVAIGEGDGGRIHPRRIFQY